MLNAVESKYATTYLKNSIVYQTLSSDVNSINLEIAKQLVADRRQVMSALDERVPVIVDVGNAINVEKEARRYYKEKEPYEGLCAIAMVMDNYIARMIANLVFMFKEQPVTTKFFNDKGRAQTWIENIESQSSRYSA